VSKIKDLRHTLNQSNGCQQKRMVMEIEPMLFRDGQNPESECGVFCRFRSEVGVRFLLICWSRSLVSNYNIETKNDARVKCDFDVAIDFPI